MLATIEIAYAKAHEDAAGSGPHARFAVEVLELTRTLVQLAPGEAGPAALAAMVRFAEARRPSRVDTEGLMVPLSEQDPQRWQRSFIGEANGFLNRAAATDPNMARVIQAQIHAAWCSRHTLEAPPPWSRVLALYDALLFRRDDPVVRLNRLVAVAEVQGVEIALSQLESMDREVFRDFAPYHAVRADLLRRAGRCRAAREAYEVAIAHISTAAEREWLTRQKNRTSIDR